MGLIKDDYEFVAALAQETAGIVVDASRPILMDRDFKLAQETLNLESLESMNEQVRGNQNSFAASVVIESFTSFETGIFRDSAAYKALKGPVLSNLIARRNNAKELNIWSAACASGQEPISVLLSVLEALPEPKSWRIRLVASDFSQSQLN